MRLAQGEVHIAFGTARDKLSRKTIEAPELLAELSLETLQA